MTSATSSLSSDELRRVREELRTNLHDIDTRLKQTYVPPNFRITTSSTNNQRTFSTNGDLSSTVKRSRISSSSHDEHDQQSSFTENSFDEGTPTTGSSSSKGLNSSIVATNKIIKTKDELISLVNRDQQSTGRNRRMFGVLLGTLNKFKAEATAYNEQTSGLKRQEIERRLEEKQAKEREDKQHERTELIASKKNCQQKLKLVNIKLEILQRMSNYEKFRAPLRNFIRTKNKPYIFYLPKGPIDEVFETKLQDTQNDLEKEFEEFKRDCQRELDLLDDTTPINQEESQVNPKKRKLSDHNDENDDDDHDDDDDDALADLPDEITLTAPEGKTEVINTSNHPTNETSNNSKHIASVATRKVIIDESNTNKQDDQSMTDE